MDYTIISCDPTTGQIEVAYKDTAGVTVGVYAIDVPIVDNAYITGSALDIEIKHRAPTWLLERQEAVKIASNFHEIEALVVPKPRQGSDDDALVNAEMFAKVHFEQQVAEVLVKFGVLSTDPTTIPVERL